MSNVGSLVQDLVEMAEAVKLVPQLKEALNQATAQSEHYAKHVEELEINAINRKAEIDRLNDRIRSLEVERDDASFRVLEAEDKAHTVLAMAKAARVSLEQMTGLLDPPKPQPEPEVLQPQAVELTQEQRVPDPTVNTTTNSSDTASTANNQDIAHTSTSEEAPKSVANPTNSLSGSSQDTHGGGEASKGPYFGKRYHDHPVYVSLHDWLDGSGTEEDYYWRPERKTSF